MSTTKIKSVDFTGQVFDVGIDVHKTNWKISVKNNGMVFKKMVIDSSPETLSKTLNKEFPNATFRSVYEAGFSGFWTHRRLTELGFDNIVVNPADVPTSNKEKERKSDVIDCNKLARERGNGSLKNGIYIPTEEEEGLRTLSRLLDQYRKRSTQLKNSIKSHLHLTGCQYPEHSETSHWSNAFIAFLRQLQMPTQHHKEVLDFHIEELTRVRQQRLKILGRIREISRTDKTLPLLRSIPGIGLITAFTIYAELMNIVRFRNFDKLASYVGLVPSIESSDKHVIVKGITFRHTKYLRYMLVESAWHAIRKDPALSQAYLSYIKKMSKQKAIIRIAKKLLSRIRYVWRTGNAYEKAVIE